MIATCDVTARDWVKRSAASDWTPRTKALSTYGRVRFPLLLTSCTADWTCHLGLTVLVGENGSGKSTVIELLAEAYGLNPQGGSAAANFEGRVTEPGLGRHLVLERSAVRPHWSYFIRADTSHLLYSYLEQHPGPPRREKPTYHELSHGEGFLALLQTKADEPGFYLLDEPDAALSFTSSLALVAILDELVRAGSQIILATHSPIVAAVPGATILELGEWGLRNSQWHDLDLVHSWRTFLNEPNALLRHLLDEQ
jgi:predicted ATPase